MNRRFISSFMKRRLNKDLMIFPEMKESFLLESSHKLKQAIVQIERVKNVLDTSLGKCTDVSAAISLRLIELHSENLDNQEAIDICNSLPYFDPSSGKSNDAMKPFFFHELSEIYLKACDPITALSHADAAVAFLESHDKANSHVNLFSTAYGLKGLASLLIGRCRDAEDFLQLASRWSSAVCGDALEFGCVW